MRGVRLVLLVMTPLLADQVTAPDSKPLLPRSWPALDSIPRYVGEVVRTVLAWRTFDLVICGHINLLPLAKHDPARIRMVAEYESGSWDLWEEVRSEG